GELLPMAVLPPIILPALELEDVKLVFLAVADHFDRDRRTLDGRCSRRDRFARRGKQHLIEDDLVSRRLLLHQRKPESRTGFGAPLLSEGLENRVHSQLQK